MLHEVLYMLLGKPGTLFRVTESSVEVKEHLPFLHPHEDALLNQLGHLAFAYMHLEQFVHTNSQSTHSLYLSAFVSGLDLYLHKYRQCLVDLECDLLTSGKHCTLAYIKYRVMYPYGFVLPDLWLLCQNVDRHRAHNVSVLQLIHNATLSGKSDLCEAVTSIQSPCHKVLLAQLSSLMLHGLPLDPHRELFLLSKLSCHSGGADVNAQEWEEVDDEGEGRGGRNEAVADDEGDESGTHFQVDLSRLPSYILPHVAHNIAFVAESLRMFQQKHRCASFFAKQKHFADQMDILSHSEKFKIREFEHFVEEMRSEVGKELWTVIVEEANLLSVLEQLRNVYLLGEGQLVLLFIHLTKPILQLPIGRNTEYDINCALLRAHNTLHPVALLDLKEANAIEKVKVVLDKQDQVDDPNVGGGRRGETSSDNWAKLSIEYSPDWPLNFVLTSSVLNRCNKLFKFLLRFKLVEDGLHQMWVNLMWMRRMNRNANRSVLSVLFAVRSAMAFLIQNFYYYLQVDVISSNYSKVCSAIKQTNDYETLVGETSKFITQIMLQSFVEMSSVNNCLNNILQVCHMMHRLVERISQSEAVNSVEGIVQSDEKSKEVFEKCVRRFNKHSGSLYRTLNSLSQNQPHAYLCQLMMRLDFNSFYSQCSGALIDSKRSI